jgi:membrane-bound ClpP family serine protease
MVELIIALFVLGLILISFEFIVPGGILGMLGGLAVIAAWVVAFSAYGAQGGLLAVVGGILVLALMLTIEIRILPRTRFGRKLFLDRAIQSTSHKAAGTLDIVGREGEALTSLSPTGVVVVDGKKFEAFSMSGFVERGTRLQVVDFDNFRVRVRKL